MEQLSNQNKLPVWMGFVMQGAFLALFLTAGAQMQKHLGIPGLVLSELMFLFVAVLYCLIRGVKLKEMFPVKKITVADFFGTVFLGIASFLLAMVCIGISLCVLPVSARKEVSGLNEFLYGRMGYLPIVLIVAVLPAICEEAMERGCVLSHFRSIKKDWVILLIMGLFFGIMHWSPLRFLNTAVMGACLSYLLVKKNNILLPMILHFGNNFVSATIGYLSNSTGLASNSDLTKINAPQALGAYLVFACSAPIFIVLARMLIDRKKHKAIHFGIAGAISFIMFMFGFMIVASSAVLQAGA